MNKNLLLQIFYDYQQVSLLAFTEVSDLWFTGYTSLPSSMHVGTNKDLTVFFTLDTLCINWKNQWLFTKTAKVYAIREIEHH